MFIIPMLEITPHGGNRILIRIANYLTSRGTNVKIVTTKYDPVSLNYTISKQVEVVKIFAGINSRACRWLLFLLFSPFYMRGKAVLANHFLTFFPSKISTYIFNSKCFYFVQGVEYECYIGNIKFDWFLKWLCLLSYKSKNIISANDYLTSQLECFTNVNFEFKLGVDSPLNIKQTPMYDIVYFARPEKFKGVNRFIDIVNKNKELTYLCISQDKELLLKLSELKQVTTVSPDNDFELAQNIVKGRISLLTSYYEGFSLPPLECMNYGIPLLYFECGGPSVYVSPSNSELLSSTNDFSKKYQTIMGNYNQYAQESFATSKKFNIESSLDRLYKHLTY